MNSNKFMEYFKSLLSAVLIALVVSLPIAFVGEGIEDVHKYADEAVAVELSCRDGNYDNARCYKVTNFEDGSSIIEFAARDLDDFAVKAYYDKDGSYLYTEKDVSSYIAADIFGGIALACVLALAAYAVYYVLVEIAEAIIKLIKKSKEKRAEKEAASEKPEPEVKDVSSFWNDPLDKK